jgi:hypothetical protein
MAIDMQTGHEPHAANGQESSMTGLVAGIIDDFQRLMEQQLRLLRREVQDDFGKTLEALTLLAVGGALAAVAGILVAFALAHWLNFAYPDLPLWGAYAIVGGGLALMGGALLYAGTKRFESFNPLPDESAQALKENVQCLMKTQK